MYRECLGVGSNSDWDDGRGISAELPVSFMIKESERKSKG
jgi:hypothetical protein